MKMKDIREADRERDIKALAGERSEILARKHSGMALSSSEQERLDSLTARLTELVPPVSVRALEVLSEMVADLERIEETARERRQRLGLD